MTTVTDENIANARRLVEAFHAAVLSGNPTAADDASKAYDNLIDTLNGGTNFGAYADESSPGTRIEAALSAEDGVDPMWGQAGCFFVAVDGMPAVVVYTPAFLHGHVELHAVRLDHPFVSETGYRSIFLHGKPASQFAGRTVREAVEAQITALQREKGLRAHPHACNLEFGQLRFVVDGLRELDTSLPDVGTHVFLPKNKQVALVVGILVRTSARGPALEIARFATAKPKRNAALTAILREEVEPWHIEQLTPDGLKQIDCQGKYLTLGVVEALEAIEQPEN